MQDLFRKHKRKHAVCEEEPEGRKKHKRHKTKKLAKLLEALDEVLDDDGMGEVSGEIGKDALHQCQELRNFLSPQRSNLENLDIVHSCQKSHDVLNAPKLIPPTFITPWKSSTIPLCLPSLPKILDPTLEAAVFIHRGVGTGAMTDLNYERLEWIGDIYMELTATLLISQTFPSLGPGKCSQHRERLVKNLTLAEYARKYGLDRRAQLPASLANASRQEMTKIHGDIFEAYVAAVILSDPEGGLRTAVEWLKELWGMTLAKEIINEEKMGSKVDSPLWRLRGDTQKIIVVSKDTTLNPKEQLRKLVGCKAVKLRYEDAAPERKDPTNKLALFTVGVYLDGWGEQNVQLGIGEANGKKEAGAKAALMALANVEIMEIYTAKKRAYDAEVAFDSEKLVLEKEEQAFP